MTDLKCPGCEAITRSVSAVQLNANIKAKTVVEDDGPVDGVYWDTIPCDTCADKLAADQAEGLDQPQHP